MQAQAVSRAVVAQQHDGASPAARSVPCVVAGPAPRGVDLTAVPAVGGLLVQRCGGMPEPCPCHDTDRDAGHDGRGGAVQRHAASAAGVPGAVPAVVTAALRGPGAPLPASLRGWAERAFAGETGRRIGAAPTLPQGASAVSAPGDPAEREAEAVAARATAPSSPDQAAAVGGPDFSAVRVHTDATAARGAKAVSARAYTVGSDIVFAAGAYDPGSVAAAGSSPTS